MLNTILKALSYLWVVLYIYIVICFCLVDNSWYKENQKLIDYYDIPYFVIAGIHALFFIRKYPRFLFYVVQGIGLFLFCKTLILNYKNLLFLYEYYYRASWLFIIYPCVRWIAENNRFAKINN